ncbi:MAG: nitroreductase [Chromatiaceae bacterium]|nr:nitroreductase [Chromatiaceae bacterium]
MNVRTALLTRKSTRAFLPKPVEQAKIEHILDAARHAPSGSNIQPWQVAVVSGAKKQELQQQLESAFRSNGKGALDYQYYPTEWQPPYSLRRKACGLLMYQTLGITREDRQQQLDQWAANYRAFDAPVMLFFFMDPSLETGSFFDYGMFVQSIMLCAVEEGLASCPQAALGEYPVIVKRALGYSEALLLICGMALGYEDQIAPVNSYRTDREEVASFTRFFA